MEKSWIRNLLGRRGKDRDEGADKGPTFHERVEKMQTDAADFKEKERLEMLEKSITSIEFKKRLVHVDPEHKDNSCDVTFMADGDEIHLVNCSLYDDMIPSPEPPESGTKDGEELSKGELREIWEKYRDVLKPKMAEHLAEYRDNALKDRQKREGDDAGSKSAMEDVYKEYL